jgi:hypothetical protein
MAEMKKGLMAPEVEITFIEPVDPVQNKKNLEKTIKDWNLGPEVASPKPGENKEYWVMMADIWSVEEAEARRMLCANCEYFDNTPEQQEAMESVPFNHFDADGGGKGWCTKFDFICHNLRVCQAWERKDYESEED